jgi:hypothetical protein
MSAPVILGMQTAQLPWLLCGLVAGYLLIMCTNPVRASLRNGLRAIQRYPSLGIAFGVFGSAHALFQLGLRYYFHHALPAADPDRPEFAWIRARGGEVWRDPHLWLFGSDQSLWHLPANALRDAARDSALPALENAAGIFNCLLSTFPLAAFAGVLFLVNWEGHHGVLLHALRRRFGSWGWLVYGGILLCALAAISKPLLYAAPQFFALAQNADAARIWYQWSPVVEWLAFLFEYLFGVCIQIYLILLAYCWVRGITVEHQHLLDFAIRRFSFVVKWASLVIVLSSLFIHLPLILKNFPFFSGWFPSEPDAIDFRVRLVRSLLTVVLFLFATVQITLIFHSESLAKALRDHLRFLARNFWPFGWFLFLAVFHLYLVNIVQLLVQRGLGEGVSLGLAWSLLSPWFFGIVAAWLLAAWVCLFKQCDTGRSIEENWIKF